MDYERFLGAVGKRRGPSGLNLLGSLLATAPPTTIFMSNGLPNPELFPFKGSELTLADGSSIKLDGKDQFQYTSSLGTKEFNSLGVELISHFHNPPTMKTSQKDGGLMVLPTIGNMDSINKVFEAVLNPGDYFLCEEPTYPLGIVSPQAIGAKHLGVQMDKDGLIPDSLRAVLSRWRPEDSLDPTSDIPRLIYLIPNAQNPSGSTMTLERKQEVYQICHDYDIMIIEDDPYYFAMFDETPIPSFLSMDVDGRVIRCDSFSKIICPGLRTGYIAGPEPIIKKVFFHTMCSVFHVPTMSQMLVVELFKRWGMDGFVKHTRRIAVFYRERKDMMLRFADKWLTGLAEWDNPKGGLFIWFKLHGVPSTVDLIDKLISRGIIMVPGAYFMIDQEAPSPYMRACYSFASEADMDRGFKNLADVIKEEQALHSDSAVTGH